MGRIRNKKWADEFLRESKYVLNDSSFNNKNWKDYFKNDYPVEIELGHGKGDFLVEKLKENKKINFVGIEKNITIQGLAIKKIIFNNKDLNNIYFLNIDVFSLDKYFEKNSLKKIYINFPDPWPKDRHKKRRLIYIDFLDIYYKLLKKNGIIEFKTDNLPLFEFLLEELKEFQKFKIIEKNYDLHKKNNKKIIKTEYEKKFIEQGKPIYYLKIKK
ncbi:MAG: tRNA (guanine-N(7)-)-methyltransferase [Candidatus Hepatoplasma vulgare]|nr:MAG: tRNA (guanine-N(7)-)-methyltransferase [Candidatus Hepatoplasma sp.]